MTPLLLVAIGIAQAAALPAGSIRQVDGAEVRKLVRERRGRVVLLNIWASWCAPCAVEFPEIVAVERAYRERGLSVISVSADSPGEIETELLPFLDQHRPGFPVYLRKTGNAGRFLRAIDPDWKGEIPASFFIDRKGRTVARRFSLLRRAELEAILEKLFP